MCLYEDVYSLSLLFVLSGVQIEWQHIVTFFKYKILDVYNNNTYEFYVWGER